ncbi:hypothetical protein LOC67_15095 [Stieleria sp. JC731]|uniref:DUF6653 family protein n=1 Tax=Pirellulaceae TaxID=2691357 RepID=UPI001E56AA3F|nr:DUF6653 family protein [Stieleria sp. JC731]MCC9601886.1 hypothetical protein [Stieleria sp. JC731]
MTHDENEKTNQPSRLFKATEAAMLMDDLTWQRHANPWSGWTRVATMPLLSIAIWSRVWIQWWALVPITLVAIWIWVNPRLFPPPKSLDNWMSRGVLGEQIWLGRVQAAIASHHLAVVRATTWIAGVGGIVWIVGLITLNLTAAVAGLSISMLGKLWFLDRMVWIYRDHEASLDDRPSKSSC